MSDDDFMCDDDEEYDLVCIHITLSGRDQPNTFKLRDRKALVKK